MPASARREVLILEDAAAIAAHAAETFVQAARDAVNRNGSFSVALSGGSTPKILYSLLANDPLRAKVPWDKLQLFFGDERHVGPDDSQSNYKLASDVMISKAPIKPGQVERMKGEYSDTEQAALEYEGILRKKFRLKSAELPRFDLVLAGMGDEGHTLSLFPGTKALHAQGRMVVRNWVGKFFTERITFTASLANNAAMILFMVTGKEKALALKGVLEGPYEPEQLPAQFLQPTDGQLLWLVDKAAGNMLSTGIRK
ncbi:MAG: 6-phosphogluconolactonase [Acidobacteriota bacterium]|nr:6-phosphogluconolactonase [Acidobacteriota bacterium]